MLSKGDCMFAHFDSSLEILPKGEKENKRTGHFLEISLSSTMGQIQQGAALGKFSRPRQVVSMQISGM